ncbi:MAG TPA: glycine/sarcosine/betaine reductase component B subunit [Synergistales bacterium]|nr:glycine/sarcosine/betaine reductase component B subunit [Synergistales bacterium]HPC75373.1 glycine/sarcosine/betaine reductase component B subunit [Synergistales bacterium]HRS48190.1 glycine/sarcosine/betaine reductase component B subunit [Thermovirgaceae bacterium]HRU90616.1 glycine/sarcosine/betaine reductase component B subunit [Thermovirgaceae bacterium]
MELKLKRVTVRSLLDGDRTSFDDGVLKVNRQEIVDMLMKDQRFSSAAVELALPGESTRILPVKDVVEPRCKLEGPGEVFPGFIGDVETVGEGTTLVLSGAAVVTCGKIVGFQEGIIDMSGPGADYTPFSKTLNVVLVVEPVEGLEKHEYESACRLAGLKTAHYLAKAAKGVSGGEVETYCLPDLAKAMTSFPGLPKVAYLYMLQSQGLLHDTYVYGVDAKRIIPTLIHPNEVMDGAIVSGNCVSACDKNNTYSHQNNPIIHHLYKRHGKDLNFIGCVITNENTTLADKKRSSSYAVKLAKMLGVEGVIISEEGFGNPDTDLIMNCRKAEQSGIKTVLVTDEYAGRDGASQSLADACPEADAVVTAANANEIIVLPRMDRIIGLPDTANVIAGGFQGSLREDGSIEVEIQAITGATSELGFSRIGAYTI